MRWNDLFQQYLQDSDLAIVDVVNLENDINPEIADLAAA